MKPVRPIQEYPTFQETRRFLEHEVARVLPEHLPNWDEVLIDECSIHIYSIGSEHRLTVHLFNFFVDFFALRALHSLDLDTPCHTMGDIADGKFGLIPTESIRRYGETHKNQILNWLASKQYKNSILSKTGAERLERILTTAAKMSNGGTV
jgi:hypothetical protein